MTIPFDPQRADKATIYIQDEHTHEALCSIDAETGAILAINRDRQDDIISIMARSMASQRQYIIDLNTGLTNMQKPYLALLEDLRELATKHGLIEP